MIIRIDQNTQHFPIYFHRARVWGYFVRETRGIEPIYLVHRHSYRTAETLLPGEAVHRCGDDVEGQIEKTLQLAGRDREIYCHFGDSYECLRDKRLMLRFRKVLFFGTPGEQTIHCHCLINGDLHAKLETYHTSSKTHLLTGSAFALPASYVSDFRADNDSACLFLYRKPELVVCEILQGAFRDLNIPLTIYEPADQLKYPRFDQHRFVCTDADTHLQELCLLSNRLLVFAGNRNQLKSCYAFSVSGQGQSLGWIPALGRQELVKNIQNFMLALKRKKTNMGETHPSTLERIFKMTLGDRS